MGSHFLRDLATTWPPNTPTHQELLGAADRLDELEAEVKRLRDWTIFAADEIATQKSSACYLRDEIEHRWRVAFDSVGSDLDAYDVAMDRAAHDYDASCAGAVLADAVHAVCDEFLPAPPDAG